VHQVCTLVSSPMVTTHSPTHVVMAQLQSPMPMAQPGNRADAEHRGHATATMVGCPRGKRASGARGCEVPFPTLRTLRSSGRGRGAGARGGGEERWGGTALEFRFRCAARALASSEGLPLQEAFPLWLLLCSSFPR